MPSPAPPASPSPDLGPWLVRPVPRPDAETVLVTFSHAGAGVACYMPWARRLSDQVELVSVLLPGREGRFHEPPLQHRALIVRAVAGALGPLRGRRVVFFGHSLGAMLAFETAHHLVAHGQPAPARLILSGRAAPSAPWASAADLTALPDDAFVDAMAERYGGIPDAVRAAPALLARFVPAMRADMLLHERYRPAKRSPLPIPITAWCGRADPGVREADLAGWREETTESYEERWFDGGHFYLHPAGADWLAALEGAAARS
jgi:medium-chain acyl-[acyl-carrier-protein] hydrolase